MLGTCMYVRALWDVNIFYYYGYSWIFGGVKEQVFHIQVIQEPLFRKFTNHIQVIWLAWGTNLTSRLPTDGRIGQMKPLIRQIIPPCAQRMPPYDGSNECVLIRRQEIRQYWASMFIIMHYCYELWIVRLCNYLSFLFVVCPSFASSAVAAPGGGQMPLKIFSAPLIPRLVLDNFCRNH